MKNRIVNFAAKKNKKIYFKKHTKTQKKTLFYFNNQKNMFFYNTSHTWLYLIIEDHMSYILL